MEIFRIENLNFTYPEANHKTLKNINLNIKSGEFITLCGLSGCGKTTLLRHLKSALTPFGHRSGNILYLGKSLKDIDKRTQSSEIGYVLQNPDNQIVTDKVWHELAFGLESLGYDNKTIRLRVAEMASFFNIQNWFLKNVSELSGGQKQLLNLAAIMAMQPKVIILDEPTSQLDPIAAVDFLETIKKINNELGTTIILSEHRLEEVVPMSDRVIVLDEGEIIADGSPLNIGYVLKKLNHPMFKAMPSSIKIYEDLFDIYKNSKNIACPLNVKDGREYLNEIFSDVEITSNKIEVEYNENNNEVCLQLKDIWFRYERDSEDVVKDLSLEVREGEFFAIVGGNGTGKTTSLNIMAGNKIPYRGKVIYRGKPLKKFKSKDLYRKNIGVLPQDPQLLFVKSSVEEDLYEMLSDLKIDKIDKTKRVKEIANLMEITHLLRKHPYDLSGGEQQRAALAKVMLLEPKLIFLDEPTKALDSDFKERLSHILEKMTSKGIAIVCVSHDIEFCAKYADRCSLFFNGSIVTTDRPNNFFSNNNFYTTAANRMSRHIFKNAVTSEDVIRLCKQNL